MKILNLFKYRCILPVSIIISILSVSFSYNTTISFARPLYVSDTSCKTKIIKPRIKLNKRNISINHNETFRLTVSTSDNSVPAFISSNTDIASIDGNGNITGVRPGSTIIIVKAYKSAVQCKVTVRRTVRLKASLS